MLISIMHLTVLLFHPAIFFENREVSSGLKPFSYIVIQLLGLSFVSGVSSMVRETSKAAYPDAPVFLSGFLEGLLWFSVLIGGFGLVLHACIFLSGKRAPVLQTLSILIYSIIPISVALILASLILLFGPWASIPYVIIALWVILIVTGFSWTTYILAEGIKKNFNIPRFKTVFFTCISLLVPLIH